MEDRIRDVDVVLVPVDGSESSARALPVAWELARRLDAQVRLLSAVAKEQDLQHREEELAALDLPDGRALRRTVVLDPDPVHAIHDALLVNRPAVACMAIHGRGRSAALVGSVATEVVARGHDPLVLVGPLVGDRRGPAAGVVTCVDDTPASAALIPLALGWARRLVQPLEVVTVAEPVPRSVSDGSFHPRFGPEGDVDAFLKELLARVAIDEDAPVSAVPLYDPISPAEGVRSYLYRRDDLAALVVVSSRARTGVSRLVFGSVAATIVHHSPSPVMVVPRRTMAEPETALL